MKHLSLPQNKLARLLINISFVVVWSDCAMFIWRMMIFRVGGFHSETPFFNFFSALWVFSPPIIENFHAFTSYLLILFIPISLATRYIWWQKVFGFNKKIILYGGAGLIFMIISGPLRIRQLIWKCSRGDIAYSRCKKEDKLFDYLNKVRYEKERQIINISQIKACERYIKSQLLDPRTYKRNNSIYSIKRSGLIDYTTLNKYGGPSRQVLDCHKGWGKFNRMMDK